MIHTVKHRVEFSIGDKQIFLSLSWNIENITVKKCTTIPSLHFSQKYTQDNDKICKLPLFNQLENIETTEREDVGRAVYQLTESANLGIKQEIADKWFDEYRQF